MRYLERGPLLSPWSRCYVTSPGIMMPSIGSYLPVLHGRDPSEYRRGRNVYEGYQRGWGLAYSDLGGKVDADPDYQAAFAVAQGRTIMAGDKLRNLFLLMRFFVPQLGGGHVIEFGSYRGGSAFFLAKLAQRFHPGMRVFALDTFAGMPPTDSAVDLHSAGDFRDVELPEVTAARDAAGLDNLELVKGRFEDTLPGLLTQGHRFVLAHIDCDIYSAVATAYGATMPHMAPGAYLVFDDSVAPSCIGATEVVEDLVVRRDGRLSEQIYPHHVFRAPR